MIPTKKPFTSDIFTHTIKELTQTYPFIKKSTIGTSHMGKPLYVFTIGNGPKSFMYNGAHHANEWISAVLLSKFLEDCAKDFVYGSNTLWPSKITLHIVPMVNPDGVDLVTGGISPKTPCFESLKSMTASGFPDCWKANIRGVDLNSNYPAGWSLAKLHKEARGYNAPGPRDYTGHKPLSEPESKALADYTISNDFELTLSLHTQGEVIYWRYKDYMPTGAKHMAERLSAVSGYALEDVPDESSHGGYRDWFIETFNKPGFTIECGLGENPLPISQFDEIYKKVSKILWEPITANGN